METKMNPCVLCGAAPLLLSDSKGFYATKCSNEACENSTYKTYEDKDAATEDWNRNNPV